MAVVRRGFTEEIALTNSLVGTVSNDLLSQTESVRSLQERTRNMELRDADREQRLIAQEFSTESMKIVGSTKVQWN